MVRTRGGPLIVPGGFTAEPRAAGDRLAGASHAAQQLHIVLRRHADAGGVVRGLSQRKLAHRIGSKPATMRAALEQLVALEVVEVLDVDRRPREADTYRLLLVAPKTADPGEKKKRFDPYPHALAAAVRARTVGSEVTATWRLLEREIDRGGPTHMSSREMGRRLRIGASTARDNVHKLEAAGIYQVRTDGPRRWTIGRPEDVLPPYRTARDRARDRAAAPATDRPAARQTARSGDPRTARSGTPPKYVPLEALPAKTPVVPSAGSSPWVTRAARDERPPAEADELDDPWPTLSTAAADLDPWPTLADVDDLERAVVPADLEALPAAEAPAAVADLAAATTRAPSPRPSRRRPVRARAEDRSDVAAVLAALPRPLAAGTATRWRPGIAGDVARALDRGLPPAAAARHLHQVTDDDLERHRAQLAAAAPAGQRGIEALNAAHEALAGAAADVRVGCPMCGSPDAAPGRPCPTCAPPLVDEHRPPDPDELAPPDLDVDDEPPDDGPPPELEALPPLPDRLRAYAGLGLTVEDVAALPDLEAVAALTSRLDGAP